MKTNLPLKFLALLLLSALLLTGCAGAASAAATTASTTGSVTSVTSADTIETSGNLGADQLTALTWGTGGTVEKVNVKTGQSVKAGQVLAILKADSVSSAIITAQSDLASAQRDLQTLMQSQAAQAAAQLAVANAEQAVSDAQIASDSLNYPRASEALVNNTDAKITQAKRAVMMATDRYRMVQRRADGDPLKTEAELALTNAQLSLNTLIATYNWYTGTATSIDADLAAANLSSAKAALADAQSKWEILKNGPDPVDVAASQARVDVAQSTVNSMAIIAPFDGEVLTVQTAAGNPVNSGDAAIEMVNLNTLKVEALVDETVISSVAVGNEAEVSLDLLPGVTLKGKVTVISAIGTTVDGLIKYTVTIALEPTAEQVRFGATANVILHTGEAQTLLAVPLTAVQSDSQGEYVSVIGTDGSTRRVIVESGDLSSGLVTLKASADLKEGDQVQLVSASSSGTTSNASSASQGGGLPLPGGGGPAGN